ncbi:lipoprotein [Chitinimonas sp. BJYL2]
MRRFALCLMTLVLVAGCGYKGPLYQPDAAKAGTDTKK